MSYLDELNGKDDPINPSTREKQQTTAQGWIPNCDFKASLGDTLQLWDAVRSTMPILAFDDEANKQTGLQRCELSRRRRKRTEYVGRGE